MNFLQLAINKQTNDYVKKKFRRFGKGAYAREELLIKSGSKVQVQAGFEYADDLFALMMHLIKEPAKISGFLVTKEDKTKVKGSLDSWGVKYSERAGKYKLDGEIQPEKLKEFYEQFKLFLFGVSLKTPNYELKVKPSPPKPGSLKEKFCTAKFQKSDLALITKEFLEPLNIEKFKKVSIKATINIEEIEVPKEFENDAKLARLKAIRRGTVTRVINVDGEETTREDKFES